MKTIYSSNQLPKFKRGFRANSFFYDDFKIIRTGKKVLDENGLPKEGFSLVKSQFLWILERKINEKYVEISRFHSMNDAKAMVLKILTNETEEIT